MQQGDLSKLRARAMRKAMTPAEAALWFALRDRRFRGLKFRRQVPLGPYIADFYCADLGLILEADGDSHDGSRDRGRDHWLRNQGFRVLHFTNRDILGNLPGCLDALSSEVAA